MRWQSSTYGFLIILATAIPAAGQVSDFSVSRGPTGISGQALMGADTLSFSSQAATADTIDLSFEYRNGVIVASYDRPSGVLSIDGLGAQVLAEDRPVIQLAHDELVSREGLADEGDTPGFLLERMLLLLSDVPAGYVWNKLELQLGTERQTIEDPPRGDPGPFAPCNEQFDNDTSLIGCLVQQRPTSHDACNQSLFDDPPPDEHGFLTENVISGCGSASDCLGRCGPGCGFSGGKGRYAQDCADHDRCCRVHGGCLDPGDGQCGDEWAEAADDYFGSSNCQQCENPPGDGGGGFPPPPQGCGPARDVEKATWLVGAGEASTQDSLKVPWAKPARLEQRGERSFVFEEWALLGYGGALASSDADFADAAVQEVFVNRDLLEGLEVRLVVDSPVHPFNERWIPRPRVRRWQGQLPNRQASGQSNSGETWFRLELSKEGRVDQLSLLAPETSPIDRETLRAVVDDHAAVSLLFDGDRRHRVVLFGRLAIASDNSADLYALEDALVVLPMCCCVPDQPFCV